MSITSIEDLSNDIFHEVFDYINGVEIYQAFSNLNYRFQQLLNSSSLLFKIELSSSASNDVFVNSFQQLLLNNKHQIFSISMCLSFNRIDLFSSISIDSSFIHLESIILNNIPSTKITSFLSNLSVLPRLYSLTVGIDRGYKLDEIYQLVMTLSKLKYFECSSSTCCESISLPIANDKQLNSIKKLVINHSCTLNELYNIISYTPELYYLKLTEDFSNDYSLNDISLPFSYSNLTHLIIEMCSITFDELEKFIIETECNLKVLHVCSWSDYNDYLDANRWEELIINYLPELEDFNLKYHQTIDPESGSAVDFQPPDAFNTLFWNEQQLALEIEMDSCDIEYSICSYKDRWYDIDSSNELLESTRLILTSLPDDDYCSMISFELTLRDILTITQIYHLEISETSIPSDTLMNILFKFSAIDSLKLRSLILSLETILSVNKQNNRVKLNKNKITKIYLEEMNGIEDVCFLMKICPYLTFLRMDFIDNKDVELFVKNILKRINNERHENLRLLCLHISTEDDELVHRLQQMINHEKLLDQFEIERVLDNIYLGWE